MLENAQLKKDVITPEKRDALVADWASMKELAKKLVPTISTDGKTCHAIRKEVIQIVIAKDETAKAQSIAILAGTTLDSASEDSVRMLFGVIGANAAQTAQVADSTVADALTGNNKTVADGELLLVGRDKFLNSTQQGFEEVKK